MGKATEDDGVELVVPPAAELDPEGWFEFGTVTPGVGRFLGRGEAAGVGVGVGAGVAEAEPPEGAGAVGTAGVPVTEFDATDAPVVFTAFRETG